MGDHRDLVFTEQVLRDLFLSLDTSGDGFLSYQELWDGLNGSDVDWDELNTEKQLVMDRLWVQADRDGNDRVSFAEFWELIAASRSPTETEMTRAFEFFKMLDKSGDGARPSHGRRDPEFRILVGFSPSLPSLPLPDRSLPTLTRAPSQPTAGLLDRLEIQEGLQNPDIDWTLLGFDADVNERHIFSQADSDGDNRVTFDEFWKVVLKNVSQKEAAKARAAAQMVSLVDFALWSAEDVGDWLEDEGYGVYRDAFEANGIHGYALLRLTFDNLPRLQVRDFDHCRGIMTALRRLRGAEPSQMETYEDCMGKAVFHRSVGLEQKRGLRMGTSEDFETEEVNIRNDAARPQMLMREAV